MPMMPGAPPQKLIIPGLGAGTPKAEGVLPASYEAKLPENIAPLSKITKPVSEQTYVVPALRNLPSNVVPPMRSK